MDPSRIPALLEPFLDRPLTSAQLEQTSIYIDLLLRWNARINLTAVREPAHIVTRHFGESFFLARHIFPDRVGRTLLSASGVESPATNHQSLATVLDLGSGAGFPGLPVKIWAPGIHLTLVESNHKKATFLREVVRALTLTNVDVIAERAETLFDRFPPDPDRRMALPPERLATPPPMADVVTFRAVENFQRTLPLALRFVAPGGRLAILVGSSQLPRISADAPLQWTTNHVPQSQQTILAIATK